MSTTGGTPEASIAEDSTKSDTTSKTGNLTTPSPDRRKTKKKKGSPKTDSNTTTANKTDALTPPIPAVIDFVVPKMTRAYKKLPTHVAKVITPVYDGTVPSFFKLLFQLQECRRLCYENGDR